MKGSYGKVRMKSLNSAQGRRLTANSDNNDEDLKEEARVHIVHARGDYLLETRPNNWFVNKPRYHP